MSGVVLPITVTLAHPGAPLHLHAEVDYASCKDACIPYYASLDCICQRAWRGRDCKRR